MNSVLALRSDAIQVLRHRRDEQPCLIYLHAISLIPQVLRNRWIPDGVRLEHIPCRRRGSLHGAGVHVLLCPLARQSEPSAE